MMKIAFIVYEFPKLSESFIVSQITGLLDLGHDVHIFANRNPAESQVHAEIGTGAKWSKYRGLSAAELLYGKFKVLIREEKYLIFDLNKPKQ